VRWPRLQVSGLDSWTKPAPDTASAADHAQFGLPEVTVGLVADSGGVLRLPRRIPRAIATELLLTGRRMGAAEAADWGLVNRVVPQKNLPVRRWSSRTTSVARRRSRSRRSRRFPG
jgi:enoyl-CoA hydratase/carnithine racemase